MHVINPPRNDAKLESPPKSEWGPGPWQDEPDEISFVSHGLPCMLRRAPAGVWCGYVGIDRTHRANAYTGRLRVHWGVTWHAEIPAFEPAGILWIGFDCAHHGDTAPAIVALTGRTHDGDVYRGIDFARAETIALAKQIREFQSWRGWLKMRRIRALIWCARKIRSVSDKLNEWSEK